jgi:hypothetical protein
MTTTTTALPATTPPRSTARIATILGLTGGALGVVAGIVELTVGPSVRSWVGDKHDTTRLGLATIGLSIIALTAAMTLVRRRQMAATSLVAVALCLLVPGLLCFTTVGRLWYVPGLLLVSSAALTLAGARDGAKAVLAAAGRTWTAILTGTLAVTYIALGLTAQGLPGAVGIVGGLVTIGLVAIRGRIPRPLAPHVLLLAVAPFALSTWWSLVAPLIAVLIVVIGAFALAPVSPGRMPPISTLCRACDAGSTAASRRGRHR